jgi:hypothetical protein
MARRSCCQAETDSSLLVSWLYSRQVPAACSQDVIRRCHLVVSVSTLRIVRLQNPDHHDLAASDARPNAYLQPTHSIRTVSCPEDSINSPSLAFDNPSCGVHNPMAGGTR